LAAVWSKSLGERASELVAAPSRLRIDEAALRGLEEAHQRKRATEEAVSEVRQAVDAGRTAAGLAERALRSLGVTEGEVAALRAEAERPAGPDARRGAPRVWARVEVRAPRDGVLLERNPVVGDIVDVS